MTSITQRRKRESFLPWVQLVLDCAAIYFFLWLVFWFRFKSAYFVSLLGRPDYKVYYRSFHLIVLIHVFFLRSYGLYRTSKFLTFAEEIARVLKAVVSSVLVLMAVTFFIRGFTFSRTFLVMVGIILAFGISSVRFLLGVLVIEIDKRRGSLRNVLLIGCDENAEKLIRFYKKSPRLDTQVVGILDDALKQGATVGGVSVLGKVEDLREHLQKHYQVHEVVLSLPGLSAERVLKIIYECEKEMVTFRWIADIFGLIASRMGVSYLGGVSILSFTDSPLTDWENRVLKRTVDILVSAVAMFILSPFFILLAVWIKLDSPGPIFYRQQRIGENGKNFMLLKFRTMRSDAEQTTGPVWTVENDPRRTRFGAFLRSTNLDELPQFWNVFKGDMSLVGPRPERPFFVSQFKEDIPRYMARHSIRSGMTGWAQVNGLRGNTSIEERTKFDLYYIENWSLFFDVKILFLTLFTGRNAY